MQDSQTRTTTAAIWARVLDVEVDDSTDFFEAGGHSFAAMRITAMVDDAFDMRTPARLLFDNPRFGDFVTALEGQSRSAGSN
ncbi:phosphopantetheine-binding protein [Kitasatospora aureofaciens]|uniref:phosphopantetheine-binding protein n=1 Tax=Kitasatospora aureofaciens TaxID=1894 RepID=UPI0037C5F7D5